MAFQALLIGFDLFSASVFGVFAGVALRFCHSFLDFFHSTGRVDQLLIAGIKTMAGRNKFPRACFRPCATSKSVPATAGNFWPCNTWMNFVLHKNTAVSL